MDLLYVKGKRDGQELIMTVLVPVLLGILSLLLVKNYTNVYTELPSKIITPPVAVFPVVWAVVLILMGISSYRMKLAAPSSVSHFFYAAQLLLAFVWNVILLRFEKLNISFVLIILYLIFITATFFEFEKTDKKAGYLMLPALIWAIILVFVNFYICRGYGSV